MASSYMRRCSTSLIFKEMQIKTRRYFLMSIRMNNIKMKRQMLGRIVFILFYCIHYIFYIYGNNKCRGGTIEMWITVFADWNAKWCSLCEKSLASPQKIEDRITIWFGISHLRTYQKELIEGFWGDIDNPMFMQQ